ncbi:DUF1120 domain-containing protein [Serratia ureilytica]|uniref:DUF1120 domain-containing protein n=1 Tax=Serratia ureilytica TaxID=300181 RepID=UPI00159C52E0|nr:DUF1120 domain-containing protein [Serratia ureilytica]NVM51919.1 DUF1120 domain-containing protein [Serratia ureilytica]
MMNAVKKTACALAVLATSTAVMAESIDVKVIGTITPTACKPTLSGGGTIDYGTINPNTLKRDDFTVLAEKQIDFAITCDAPAKVGLRSINNRPSTLAGVSNDDNYGNAPVELLGRKNPPSYGLGLDNNKRIGGYSFNITSAKADGEKVKTIYKNDDQTSWNNSNWDLMMQWRPTQTTYSWSKSNSTNPVAFTTLAGTLGAQAYINKASELDLTKPVKLDGLTTLELVYL